MAASSKSPATTNAPSRSTKAKTASPVVEASKVSAPPATAATAPKKHSKTKAPAIKAAKTSASPATDATKTAKSKTPAPTIEASKASAMPAPAAATSESKTPFEAPKATAGTLLDATIAGYQSLFRELWRLATGSARVG